MFIAAPVAAGGCRQPSVDVKATDARALAEARDAVVQAHSLAQAERDGAARLMFERALAHPGFDALSCSERSDALSAAALLAYRNDELDKATRLYGRALALDDGDPDDWYRLSVVEFEAGSPERAAEAMIELVERWPELSRNIRVEHLFQTFRGLSHGTPLRLRFLQALADARWEHPRGDESGLWYELAKIRIERGELQAAREMARRVWSPLYIVRMRSDKRFDGVIARDSPTFDPQLAAGRAVERLRRKADASPGRLDAQVQLTYAMLNARRYREVLDTVAAVDAAIGAAPTAKPPFEDMDQHRWLMNNRAIALRRLGRYEDAVAEMRRASRFLETEARNINQALNFALLYCALGDAERARSEIAEINSKELSPYGAAIRAGVRLRIAVLTGDARSQRSALTELRERSQIAPEAYLEGLLYAGRLEPASRQLRELLRAPQTRDDMLLWLQDYSPSSPLPSQVRTMENFNALRARAEVRAAIDAVGRIERYDIDPTYGFD